MDGTGPPTSDELCARLETVDDPILGDDVVSLGLVDGVHVDDQLIVVRMGLYAPYSPAERRIVADVHETLSEYEREVITVGTRERTRERGDRLAGVRNVVPFVGAHGAVGTSTVATNVAFALSRVGARVGVLELDGHAGDADDRGGEADGSGPSATPATVRGVSLVSSRFVPVSAAGKRPGESPSDPRATIDRLTLDVGWGGLDYLFADVATDQPDLRNALFDRVSTAGAVVTAARATSIVSVRGCLDRLDELGVTPLGLVENVDGSVRGELRRQFDLTPSRWVAGESDIAVLGTFPEDPILASDHGTAVVGENDPLAAVFDAIAANVVDAVGATERRAHARRSVRGDIGGK